jgi:protocatechuate 3,4-dioxygenase beta subunit
VRPEYAGRAGGTIAGVKKVLAVVFAVAAVVVAIVWWRGRGGEPPRPAPSATVGSAGATLAGPGAPAPAAPLTGRVEGTVVGADGQPVPGATVAVVDRGPPRAVEPDGRFVVPDLEAGTYAVVAAAPGHLPARADAVEVAAGAAARVALTLTVGGHSVTGVVSDASGGPIEGATVTAARREALGAGDMIAATLTDRDGRYRLTLAPGSYVVSGEREDYVRATADLEVADLDRTLDLRLVPAGVVEGIVKDVASGAPVAGAKVEASAARPGRFGGGRRSRPVTTDAGGRFRLTGLTPGAIALSARVDADGRQSPEPTEVLLGIGEQVTGVELWVEAAPYLAGRVVDADGRPIADANVMAMGGTSGESTQTDPDGRFRVLGLDPGAYQVFASHPRYASAPPRRIELADRSVTDLELRLTASPRVVGRVEPPTEAAITVDPDRDPAGFEPTMWTAIDQRSRPDGSFEVTPITAGAHTIAAKATDGRRGQATVVVPAQGDATVVIRLEDGGSIAGTVRDQQGQAVVGAAVIIRKTSGAVVRRMIVNGVETSADRAITDRAGAYLMRGLEAGRYELAVLDERGGALTPARTRRPDRAARRSRGQARRRSHRRGRRRRDPRRGHRRRRRAQGRRLGDRGDAPRRARASAARRRRRRARRDLDHVGDGGHGRHRGRPVRRHSAGAHRRSGALRAARPAPRSLRRRRRGRSRRAARPDRRRRYRHHHRDPPDRPGRADGRGSRRRPDRPPTTPSSSTDPPPTASGSAPPTVASASIASSPGRIRSRSRAERQRPGHGDRRRR